MGIFSSVTGALNNAVSSAGDVFSRADDEGSDWLGFVGSLVEAGGALYGGMQQQDSSQSFAREMMGFQERMSNTAHQREVDDLRRAGLNPILSTRLGGASSPTGASGTAVNFIGDAASRLVNTGMAAARLNQDIDSAEQQIRLSKQDERLRGFQVVNTGADTQNKIVNNDLLREQVPKTAAETQNIKTTNEILRNEKEISDFEAERARQGEEIIKTPAGQVARKAGAIARELLPLGQGLNSARSLTR